MTQTQNVLWRSCGETVAGIVPKAKVKEWVHQPGNSKISIQQQVSIKQRHYVVHNCNGNTTEMPVCNERIATEEM